MGDRTGIAWTDATWNPLVGCSKVSEGCRHCYAMVMASRIANAAQEALRRGKRLTGRQEAYRQVVRWRDGGMDAASTDDVALREWNGRVVLDQDALGVPLRWTRPRKVFVNSMSDLFHERVPDEWIDRVFAVMALAPRHTFQILTKRPERLREYMGDPATPFRVQRAIDAVLVDEQMARVKEERRPLQEFPDYEVSNFGVVYSRRGSLICVMCAAENDGSARKLYCSQACRQAAAARGHHVYDRRPVPMSPAASADGHLRVMLYRDGEDPVRELVHRLVLSTFDRAPTDGEEVCHRNAIPGDNRIANLRWGTRENNRADRERHGRARSWSKLTPSQVEEIRHQLACGHPADRLGREFGVSGTQVRNIGRGDQWATTGEIEWPLPGVWLGVSVEDQATADARIPLLLQTPAAVRFVSYEPALGPVDWLADELIAKRLPPENCACHIAPPCSACVEPGLEPLLDWVIVGGESGLGHREMDLAWLDALDAATRAAGVALFVKQDSGKRSGLQGRISDALWARKEFPRGNA